MVSSRVPLFSGWPLSSPVASALLPTFFLTEVSSFSLKKRATEYSDLSIQLQPHMEAPPFRKHLVPSRNSSRELSPFFSLPTHSSRELASTGPTLGG